MSPFKQRDDLRRQTEEVKGAHPRFRVISDIAQGSSLRDLDCVPFWPPYTREVSRKLWSCTETDLRDSPLTYWNTSSRVKGSNSWGTVKTKKGLSQPNSSPRTLWQSQQSLWKVIMENEQRKVSQYSYQDREYETLPTANHRTEC